jgi:hypothetical protein
VEVLQPDPPKIAKFRVEPESIHFGQNATLLWSVSGETESVSITPGIGSVPAEGSRGVSPRIPTTYAISVTGPGGTSTAEATLQVLTRTLAIRSFTATPQTVLPGHGVILHWSIDGDVDNVTLDPGAVRLKPEGAKLVTPMVGTRYTLTASGPGGTKSEFVDVQVSNEPIAIAYFQVRPLPLPVKEPKNLAVVKIKRGESAVISWKVTGSVTDLSIEPAVPNPQGRKTGTATVTPDRDTVYTLTAKAANRPPVSAIVKVEVKK